MPFFVTAIALAAFSIAASADDTELREARRQLRRLEAIGGGASANVRRRLEPMFSSEDRRVRRAALRFVDENRIEDDWVHERLAQALEGDDSPRNRRLAAEIAAKRLHLDDNGVQFNALRFLEHPPEDMALGYELLAQAIRPESRLVGGLGAKWYRALESHDPDLLALAFRLHQGIGEDGETRLLGPELHAALKVALEDALDRRFAISGFTRQDALALVPTYWRSATAEEQSLLASRLTMLTYDRSQWDSVRAPALALLARLQPAPLRLGRLVAHVLADDQAPAAVRENAWTALESVTEPPDYLLSVLRQMEKRKHPQAEKARAALERFRTVPVRAGADELKDALRRTRVAGVLPRRAAWLEIAAFHGQDRRAEAALRKLFDDGAATPPRMSNRVQRALAEKAERDLLNDVAAVLLLDRENASAALQATIRAAVVHGRVDVSALPDHCVRTLAATFR